MPLHHKKLIPLLAGLTLNIVLAGSAQAALQGRDLNGSADSFEAYYDTELDITWLADANYAQTTGHSVNYAQNPGFTATGGMNWAASKAWVAGLSFTNGVQVFDNWRLPTLTPINGVSFQYLDSSDGSTDNGYNVSAPGSVYSGSKASELAHLFYNTLGNPSYETLSGANSGACSPPNYCLKNVGPFSNVQPYIYWTDLEHGAAPSRAWNFITLDGSQDSDPKSALYGAWAVSSGDIAAPVPEAQTYAMMLAGLGLLAAVAGRRR